MTEQEAKTKWCPFARDRDGAGNRVPYGDSDADVPPVEYTRNEAMAFPCIGSACMAWRKDDPAREFLRLYKDDARRETMASAGTLRVVDGEPWLYEYSDCDEKGEFDLFHRAQPENGPKRSGYCGLAGKP